MAQEPGTPFQPVQTPATAAPVAAPTPDPAPALPAVLGDPGAIATPSGTVVPDPEPGYTTTEFWITVLLALIGLLVSFGVVRVSSGQLQTIAGLVVAVAPSLAYIFGRSIRKRGSGG